MLRARESLGPVLRAGSLSRSSGSHSWPSERPTALDFIENFFSKPGVGGAESHVTSYIPDSPVANTLLDL